MAREAKNERDKWTHTLGLAGNDDGSVTTAERWEVRGQSDCTFTDSASWFDVGRHEHDRFLIEIDTLAAVGLIYETK